MKVQKIVIELDYEEALELRRLLEGYYKYQKQCGEGELMDSSSARARLCSSIRTMMPSEEEG